MNKVFIGVFTNDCRYDTMITIKNLFKNGKKIYKTGIRVPHCYDRMRSDDKEETG